MPPSSSGGVTLIEMLNIFETFPAQLGREGSAEQRHRMIEAMRYTPVKTPFSFADASTAASTRCTASPSSKSG